MTQTIDIGQIPPDAPAETRPAPPMARTDPRHRQERRAYKIRGPETWALIRESYLAGASARELARRYDVTEWAIWRRAWKKGWTKQDRVEPTPPPALQPLLADANPEPTDANALARDALRGVARALAEGRVDEAKRLTQLATSLGRLGGGAGGGQYSLDDMVRVGFDPEFATEVMRVTPGADNPPEKARYWKLYNETRDEGGRAMAAIRSQSYREGRADLRAELGLAPEPAGPDVFEFWQGALCKVRG